MSVYKDKRSPYYSYEFVINGERFKGSTEKTNERDALSFERLKRAEERRKQEERGGRASSNITLGQLLDRFYEEKCVGTSEHKAAISYKVALCEILGGQFRVNDIDSDKLADLVAALKLKPRWGREDSGTLSNATINRIVGFLRRAMYRAKKTWKTPLGDLPDFAAYMLKEKKEHIRILAPSEHAAISGHMDPDYMALVEFALLTGLRKKSSLLLWENVNFELGYFAYIGKGGEPRRKPMSDRVRQILLSRRGHHNVWVFTYKAKRTRVYGVRDHVRGSRKPITIAGLNSYWARVKKGAGVEKLRWHDLRHTFGTMLLAKTGNLALVQTLMDHADPATTRRYAHVMDGMQRDGLAAQEDAMATFFKPSPPLIEHVPQHKRNA